MMNAKIYLLILFASSVLLGGDINRLSNVVVFTEAPEIQEVYDIFDSLLVFSDQLYQAKKIAVIRNNNPEFSDETWPPGTWGRGYFSKDVEYYPEKYFSERYATWINNERACNPLVREIGRRIMGYIHEYRNRSHASPDQIKAAIQYLIDSQLADGGYIWWFKRKGKYDVEGEPNTTENLYTSSIALRAMCEGHAFLNSSIVNDSTKNSALISAITSCADYISDYPSLYVGYPNGKFLAVWGLIGAFKVTGNHAYLKTSIKIAFDSDIVQRDDGSWVTPDFTEPYHDANIFYHGMTLRGLAELYSVLKDNDMRQVLKEKIVRSINHIIDYNGKKNTRFDYSWDGAYASEHASLDIKNPGRGMILLGGLILTKSYVDFGSEDKLNLDYLINYTINGMVYIGKNSDYYKYADADIAIHNIGMYLGFAGYIGR